MKYLSLLLVSLVLSSAQIWSQSTTEKTENVKQIATSAIDEHGYYYFEYKVKSAKATANVVSTDWKSSTNSKLTLPNSDKIESRIVYERKVPKLVVKIPAVKQEASVQEYLSGFTIKINDPESSTLLARPNYPANSVLASGNWYKIGITQRGVHKIDAAFLNQIGINTSSLNPANIRIYGNGGHVMTEIPDDSEPNDLAENAIFVSASGSTFGNSDYILFYADGLVKWTHTPDGFQHTVNYYSDTAYYFINVDKGPGKRMATINESASTPVTTYTTFDDYTVIDNDSFYHSEAGKIWWSNQMLSHASSTLNQTVNLQLTDPVGPIKIRYQVGSTVNTSGSRMEILLNNAFLKFTSFIAATGYRNIDIKNEVVNSTISSKNISLNMKFMPSGTGRGLLDYFAITGYSHLNLTGINSLKFRNVDSRTYVDQVVAYQLSNTGNSYQIWDVTNNLAPQIVTANHSGSNTLVKVKSKGINELIAFNPSSYHAPVSYTKVANQNLHSLSTRPLIIICPEAFKPLAIDLATMHQELEGIQSHIVTTSEIYNEFSSGAQDIAGIRNFIRMFYDRANNADDVPENVLLLGAASYDYKDRISGNTNFVPNFQSYGSDVFSGSSSFATDDYYGLLDSLEYLLGGSFSRYDIGIGRIPIKTLSEGNQLVAKIKNYISSKSFGPWKNNTLFLADDGDGAGNFAKDNDVIAQSLDNANPIYNHTKLYADAYQKEPGASSDTYPKVSNELNSQMNLGNLLVNYSGHGNPERLSTESILIKSQINSYTNIDRLPVVITGTCDFGRYDKPGMDAGGALLFTKANGGSIASLTTTQQVFSNASTNMISKYIDIQFSKLDDGSIYSMGTALMKAKNESGGATENNLKFVLLGDPALKIALPKLNIVTDSIKNFTSETELVTNDTLSALGSYMLYGGVKNTDGSIRSDFNGTVYVSIYDKPQKNDVLPSSYYYSSYKQYSTQSNIIYKGQAIAKNGHFEIKMIIPKDLNYEFGKGKISYYAYDDNIDASGYDTNIVIGGFADYQISDNDAPIVQVFIDDEKFTDGGVTGTDPMLYVKLSDDNGINVSGSSVGHDLIAIVDGDIANAYVLNNYYFTEPGDYTKGSLFFPLSNLTEGIHEVEVRAWDMLNNPGMGKVRFEVRNKSEGFISETYCYPNPIYESYTNFVVQHNLKHDTVDVSIQIFDNAGRNVKTLEETMQPSVNRLEIKWNARDASGLLLPSGLYHYRIIMRNNKDISATGYNKLSIVR